MHNDDRLLGVLQPSQNSPAKSQKYWLNDGTLIVQVDENAYKVHGGLLDRLSPRFSALSRTHKNNHETPYVVIPNDVGVTGNDFEALLEHLYHDIPLASDPSFTRVASVLRASSELDFSSISALARRKLLDIFPKRLEDLVQYPDAPDDALSLAVQYDVFPIQKALYYRVATHLHLDDDDPDSNQTATSANDASTVSTTPPSDTIARLSPELIRKSKNLLDDLLAHFTPVLFTVATAHHMACTDVFAETWMPLVIQPALENNGLCKPIETLQTIIDLDWKAHGLCEDCVRDKREEWRGEQEDIWKKMNTWLGLQNEAE
ncbi:unnamed protein product [Somion occarium]|uniref:BTB domain-containing protein n=1 Tax=Somion occarium TaxID=3059160 RepID=A0ABP1CIS8_9APHY